MTLRDSLEAVLRKHHINPELSPSLTGKWWGFLAWVVLIIPYVAICAGMNVEHNALPFIWLAAWMLWWSSWQK